MKKYQSYKPSGNVWIGDIPENWEIRRLKHLSSINGSNVDKNIYEDEKQVYLCNYTDVYYNEKITDKIEFKKGSCTKEEYDKFKLKKDDIIITKDSETPDDIGVPSYVTTDFENVVCGYHLTMISSNKDYLYGEYLFRQLQTNRVRNYFEINSNGITRYGLGKSPIENLDVITPSIKEQLQIVQYLDEKTGIIDKLISIKERKIDLLKHQRTSLINEVITKGLNPKVKMKVSGVEWIGEIPEHWEMIKLKYLGKSLIGLSYQPVDIVEDEKEGILVLRSSNIQNGKLSLLDNVYVKSKVKDEIIVREGDILICSRNGSKSLIGKNITITKELEGNTFGVFMTVFRSQSWGYLSNVFNSQIFKNLSGLFLTSTINQLTQDTLNNFVVPYTRDKIEQKQIVEYLDNRTKEIDDLVSMEEKKIGLLKEYRQSLITEVITGKIDVRTNLN